MMKNKIWQTLQFAKYLFRSFHLHGIHSPFVFEINESIFKDQSQYYVFDEIESLRAKLLLTNKAIKVKDLGAGSRVNNSEYRKINEIAKTAIKSRKKAQILYKIAYKFKPKTILELGTSFGISTLYLAKACPEADLITIEGADEIAKVAEINFKKLNASNIQLVNAGFDQVLKKQLNQLKKVDLVFIDGNHQEAPTLHYFQECLKHAHENSIFIFDDIYWSKEMTAAWHQIQKNEKVTVTIDCFEMGIVFFKKDQAKEHFTVYH